MEVLAIPWISINVFFFLEKFASKTWEEATVLNHFRTLRGQSSCSGSPWPVLTLGLTFSQQSHHSLGCLFCLPWTGVTTSSLHHQGQWATAQLFCSYQRRTAHFSEHWNTCVPPGSPLNIHECGLCFHSPSCGLSTIEQQKTKFPDVICFMNVIGCVAYNFLIHKNKRPNPISCSTKFSWVPTMC